MVKKNYYLMPDAFYGTPQFPLEWPELNWLQELPKNTFFALCPNLPSLAPNPFDLPLGHPLYVITFHQERIDCDWVLSQADRIQAPIIILSDGSLNTFPLPSHVFFYTYHSWHRHMEMIMALWPNRQYRRNIRYKASNICNRVTQSKMIVFTALMEYLPRQELLIKLGDWIEAKNVHHWSPTGDSELDNLKEIFQSRYAGRTISIDDFDNQKDNYQYGTSNPWQPVLTESALHFVSESYHYSLMQNEYGTMIRPGPSFSEKMFKCLVAGTPMVPVAQFHCYKHLRDLGLRFDYGQLDLSWDNDPGNISRLSGIVRLIRSLADVSTYDIIYMTKNSTDHNLDYIWSGDLSRHCRAHNISVADRVLAKFK